MSRNSSVIPLSELRKASVSQFLADKILPRIPREKRSRNCRAVASRIALVQGDITKLQVDAIVNAANPRLDGGGGVDGAIHAAAGPELLRACREYDGCATGDAKTTRGFKLPAQWVVHTVGPVYRQAKKTEHTAQLRSCYQRSLEEAVSKKATTIAFSSISTGIYGFPIDGATQTAIHTVADFLASGKGSAIDLVVFCTFSSRDHDVYADYLSYMVCDEGEEDEQGGEDVPREE